MKTYYTSAGTPVLVMNYGKSAISTNDIKYIKGDGNYSNIQVASGKKMVSAFTLNVFTKTLAAEKNFFSPNKGILINLNHLECIEIKNGSKYVKMKDGQELPISRRKTKSFMEYLETNHWDVRFHKK